MKKAILFTIATKFLTFAVQTEDQVEGIFAQQLQNLGTDYVDYYLLHILNTKFYNGIDGKGGVVKTCRLFEHARQWKEEGKIKHLGFSFHDSPEVLDQILTEHPALLCHLLRRICAARRRHISLANPSASTGGFIVNVKFF